MKRILLVEDDPLIIEIYTTKLQEAGFKVEAANNGAQAVKMLKQEKFDLLILDIVLPELTGFEVLRKIKKDPKLKNLKIIMLTNLGQKTDIEKAQNLQVDRYLIKAHFTPSEVVEEIEKILKLK